MSLFKKEDMKKSQDRIVEGLEKELSIICQKIYDLNIGGRNLILIKPWVLVRVLPKEHKTEGGIWLAEVQQNKIVYEGIVLKTWPSYEEEFKIKTPSDISEKEKFPYRVTYKVVEYKSGLDIGDRVIFSHYVGLPLGEYLDDRYYRIVKEPEIMSKLDYTGDAEVSAKIRSLTKEISSISTSGASIARGADQ